MPANREASKQPPMPLISFQYLRFFSVSDQSMVQRQHLLLWWMTSYPQTRKSHLYTLCWTSLLHLVLLISKYFRSTSKSRGEIVEMPCNSWNLSSQTEPRESLHATILSSPVSEPTSPTKLSPLLPVVQHPLSIRRVSETIQDEMPATHGHCKTEMMLVGRGKCDGFGATM